MLLQPIATLLKTDITDLRKVVGAANFAAAQADLTATPAAYVVPGGSNAQPNTLLGYSVSQKVVEFFDVILVVDNKRDVRGDAVNAPLETLRAAVLATLLGSQPATDYDPVTLAAESLLNLDVTTLWWQMRFATGYFETKN